MITTVLKKEKIVHINYLIKIINVYCGFMKIKTFFSFIHFYNTRFDFECTGKWANIISTMIFSI